MNDLTRYGNGEGLFDAAFKDFFRPLFLSDDTVAMKTDIKEFDDKYEMEIEVPGFAKNDISINLENGYLTVSAQKSQEAKSKGHGEYLKRERVVSCSRSYYVGELKEDDVKAKYENGILQLTLPKLEENLPQKKQISID